MSSSSRAPVRSRWRLQPALCWPVVLLGVLVSGCGGPSEDVPVSRLELEASGLSEPELRERARQYRDAYLQRRRQKDQVSARLKGLDPRHNADTIRTLAREASRHSLSMQKLHERYRVFYEQLERRRLNTDGLEISR